jgi:glycosyltransferase involved in cell wall biosynthesis
MTCSSPKVTIGLPVYNSERYLIESLNSLINQTYQDFVLIISDNASTDGTADICQHYVKADSRVRYFRNDVNIGNPRNFNRVFELTMTPYLKWSSADDYWAPTFLEKALEVMERDASVVLCYPQATLVDANGENPQPFDDVLNLVQNDPADRFITLLDKIMLAHQHLGVIRMSDLRRTHLLGTHVSSDINLLAELTLYGKFIELPERLFFRRFHKDSGSWKRGDVSHNQEAHDAKTYYASNERVRLAKWRAHIHFLGAVKSSPLPLKSKFRLYRYLLRRIRWDRNALYKELIKELRNKKEQKHNILL